MHACHVGRARTARACYACEPREGRGFEPGIGLRFTGPAGGAEIDVGGPAFGTSDGDYLPIVMIEPVYPARAISRELEGYVIVEFTVTRTGTTRDAAVVESSSTLFEGAAVDSALKYKYRPRVVNGEPVEVPGVRALIRFELED